jgi:hypothetical protein
MLEIKTVTNRPEDQSSPVGTGWQNASQGEQMLALPFALVTKPVEPHLIA